MRAALAWAGKQGFSGPLETGWGVVRLVRWLESIEIILISAMEKPTAHTLYFLVMREI